MGERDGSYYELLEVATNASFDEIEAAYERMSSFLATDSLVVYSLIDEEEASAQRRALEAAYQTLSDPVRRAAYDRALTDPTSTHDLAGPYVPASESAGTWSVGGAGPESPPASTPEEHHEAAEFAQAAHDLARPTRSESRPATRRTFRRLTPSLDVELNDDTEFSGSLLRRLRESAGASIEDVAEITKISRRYVRALEEHDFDSLPAKVYVRGFVSEYARALGLDGQRVASSYMSVYRRYREGKGDR